MAESFSSLQSSYDSCYIDAHCHLTDEVFDNVCLSNGKIGAIKKSVRHLSFCKKRDFLVGILKQTSQS